MHNLGLGVYCSVVSDTLCLRRLNLDLPLRNSNRVESIRVELLLLNAFLSIPIGFFVCLEMSSRKDKDIVYVSFPSVGPS